MDYRQALVVNEPNEKKSLAANNRRVAARLFGVVVLMFGFGYALVPLYDVFCELTGLNGKNSGLVNATEAVAGGIDSSRTVTVEFTGVASGLPWDFTSPEQKVQVHPGEMVTVSYQTRNRADQAVAGRAIPSVSPGKAARYFQKTECFCFTQQTLEAGEARDMTVTFVVDPDLPQEVKTITLSYSFYRSDEEESQG